MKLSELGIDHRLIDNAQKICEPHQHLARVTVVDRGQYIIKNEQGEIPAKATGKFMYTTTSATDMPCVGDWVCVDYQDSKKFASIHKVLPRNSFLRRKSAGKSSKLQMIAANIDVAFIVQSCHYDFNVSRLERYLVMANEGQVEPLLILSKTDLVSTVELKQLILEIRKAGIENEIIALSNETGNGLDQIKEIMLSGKTYCLVGSSGVGKSTLINQLLGFATLRTGMVGHTGEGRHTTVRRQLIVLEQGAMLIDTPGMREVGILGAGEEVDDNFDDIQQLSLACRFANCRHKNEPGCAILQAIAEGELQQEHYHNYIKLKMESGDTEVVYTSKRKKGKSYRKVIMSSNKRNNKTRK